MPFANEHAARQMPPARFSRIRQLWRKQGIRALGGPLKSDPEGGSQIQTIRFDASKWSASEARKWLREHDYKSSLEEATGEELSLAIDADDHVWNKDVVRTGTFIDPKSGRQFQVSPSRLDQWESAFAAMQRNGINVPIYFEHDKNQPLGNVAHMHRVGDEFYALHRFEDEEAERKAMRAGYASIKTDPAYVDCEGNEYGEVISHIAVTSEPVITRQGQFEQVLCLSRMNPAQPESQTGDVKMLEWLKGKLGLPKDASDDELRSKLDDLTGEPKTQIVASRMETKSTTGDDKAKEEALQLARDAREAVADAASDRFRSLVAEGKISAFRAKELEKILVGDKDHRNVLCLSRNEGAKPLVLSLLDVFAAEDKTVKEGEKSGAQVPGDSVTLSRGDEKPTAEQKAEKAKKLVDTIVNLAK